MCQLGNIAKRAQQFNLHSEKERVKDKREKKRKKRRKERKEKRKVWKRRLKKR